MKRRITISREFGSGGREFGRRLSEELGIAYYDQEIVSEIAERTEMSERYVQSILDSRPSISYPIHIGRSFYPAFRPVWEHNMSVYREQEKIIKELAAKSDCIIVGRCSDYILREMKPIRIFIYADMESKIRRCRQKAAEEEHLTDRELKQKIREIDKKRSQYYAFYTGQDWGDRLNYDWCINTTRGSIKEMVPLVARMFR